MEKVLVVEDEEGSADTLSLILEAEGYQVVCAANGALALDAMKARHPSLILSDYMMPTMDGAALGTAVRLESSLFRIPFVFMSGTSEEVVRKQFSDYDGFLAKPLEMRSLLTLVARLVKSGRPNVPGLDEVRKTVERLLKAKPPPDH